MRRTALLVAVALSLSACSSVAAVSPSTLSSALVAPSMIPALQSSHLLTYVVPTQNAAVGAFARMGTNMWFYEAAGDKIGVVTPAGLITEYPMLTTGSQVGGGLVKGGARYLLYTAYSGVDKVTTAGISSAYASGVAGGAYYSGLAVGSDGNPWSVGSLVDFSEQSVFKFVRNGAVAVYTTPTRGSCPENATEGPDGDVWFAEACVDKVAKVDVSGHIVEYALPDGGEPDGMAVGPDGNMYVADSIAPVLHRVTTSGVVTDIAMPGSTVAVSVVGKNGLWVLTGSLVGRGPGLVSVNLATGHASAILRIKGLGAHVATDASGNAWLEDDFGQDLGEYIKG